MTSRDDFFKWAILGLFLSRCKQPNSTKINEKITHQVSCDGIRTHDLSSIQFIICCQSLSKLSCTAPHHLNRRSKFRLERQKFKLKYRPKEKAVVLSICVSEKKLGQSRIFFIISVFSIQLT